MDDYILEILKIQEQPEESRPLKLQLEGINVRGRDPEAIAVQEQEMLRNAAAAEDPSEEAAAAQEGIYYRTAEENQKWLLRQMEPLQISSEESSLYGDIQVAGAVQKETGTGSAAFGYVSESRGEAGVSPEALSMFFQRDARRYS